MDQDWKKAVWVALTAFVMSLGAITIHGVRVSFVDVPDEQYLACLGHLLAFLGLWWWATPEKPKEP